MKKRTVLSLFFVFCIFTACDYKYSEEQCEVLKTRQKKIDEIKQILHCDTNTRWNVYLPSFESNRYLYEIRKNGTCEYMKEVYSGYIYILNIDVDSTWDITLTNSDVYLRMGLDIYRVLNYNNEYFKLLAERKRGSNNFDTLYIHKSFCNKKDPDDCFIPKKIAPAPF